MLVNVTPSQPPATPGRPSQETAELHHKEYGVLTGRVFTIGPNVIVGRFDPMDGPVEVDLCDLGPVDHISRRHARIFRQGGSWMVEDLSSKNGVFIRAAGGGTRRITAPTSLTPDDEVSFGMVTFVFRNPSV